MGLRRCLPLHFSLSLPLQLPLPLPLPLQLRLRLRLRLPFRLRVKPVKELPSRGALDRKRWQGARGGGGNRGEVRKRLGRHGRGRRRGRGRGRVPSRARAGHAGASRRRWVESTCACARGRRRTGLPVQRREGGLPRERRVVREVMTVVTARVRVQHRRIGSWAMRGPPVRMLRCKVGRPRQT